MRKFALLTALVAALALRLHGIARESAWHDEVLTLAHLHAPSLDAFLRAAYTQDPIPALCPLYHILAYTWSAAAGASVTSLRCLSIALNLAALFVLHILATRIYGARAAFIAVLLGAISLSQIYYAQEVRFYALIGLLAVSSLLALTLALEKRRPAAWAAYGLINALMLWSHAFTPLFFIGQGVAVAWCFRGRLREFGAWAGMHAVIASGFIGYLLWLHYDFGTRSQVFNDMPPRPGDLLRALVMLAGGRFSNEATAPYMPFHIGVDLVFAAAVLLAAALGAWRGLRQIGARRDAAVLLGASFAVPVILLYAAALLWRPCFFVRYIFYASYPLLLLAAHGLAGPEDAAQKTTRGSSRSGVFRPAAVMLVIGLGAYQALFIQRPFRPDYHALAALVTKDGAPAKRVLALKTFNGIGARYNLGARTRVEIFDGFNSLCDETQKAARGGAAVWAVFHQWARPQDFAASLHAGGLGVREYQLGGMPPLYAYRVTRAEK